ncbi:hypothetical protein M0R36_00980 [bacterium]|jgi:Spy/CpxP family protein refolding chaperone|nr:hypothetical protein [bacterium]
MENSKIILVALMILTLLVGGIGGYLVAGGIQSSARHSEFQKLMMLKNMSAQREGRPDYESRGNRHRGPGEMMGEMRRGDMEPGDREERREKMGKMFLNIMAKKCDLTDEQKKQVKAIFEANKGEIETAREEFKGKLDAVKDKTDSQIESILTDEQKAKFEEFKDNAKKLRMHQSMKCGMPFNEGRRT